MKFDPKDGGMSTQDVRDFLGDAMPEGAEFLFSDDAVPTPEERVTQLEAELEKTESDADRVRGELITASKRLADREAEFEKLAGAYRKLREEMDKTDAAHIAEFDNYRRRTEDEKKRIGERASADVLLALLPTLDNLDRAAATLDAATDLDAVRSGVRMIIENLRGALAAQGLERLAVVGEEFNPELHNAIATVETQDVPDGHVYDEMQTGYAVNGQLIRPAMVRVASHSSDE